jgi:hydroxypyruvate reductase
LRIGRRSYDQTAYDSVLLLGMGKASVPMATAVLEALGDAIPAHGVVVTKYDHLAQNISVQWPEIEWIEAAHPVPDENSLRGGDAICRQLDGLTPRTLVLACISGGASALVVAPHEGISLNVMRAINDTLLRSGAEITEMNAVRSRLDRLKAGGLVRMAHPAPVASLILSDVIGDPLPVIASGMTNDPQAHNVLVGNNAQSCEAVAMRARALGYSADVVTTTLRGEARDAAADIVDAATSMPARHVRIYGGETTVTVRGGGKGGRNQELALAAAIRMASRPSSPLLMLVALGTDGTDGPTDAAGAIAFGDTVSRASIAGLDAGAHLADNNAYPCFNAIGDLIKTGPTGTNVADVVIAVSGDA